MLSAVGTPVPTGTGTRVLTAEGTGAGTVGTGGLAVLMGLGVRKGVTVAQGNDRQGVACGVGVTPSTGVRAGVAVAHGALMQGVGLGGGPGGVDLLPTRRATIITTASARADANPYTPARLSSTLFSIVVFSFALCSLAIRLIGT